MDRAPIDYRQVVEMSYDGIWAMDARRVTTYVNARMAEMLGVSPADMIGRSVHDHMYEEDLPAHDERMVRRRAGVSDRYEQRFRRSDGAEVWCLVSATPLLDEAGQFQGAFAVLADITDRLRAEQALRDSEFWLRESQRVANLGSYVLDIAAGTWTCSAHLHEVFGIDAADDHTVEGWLRLIRPDYRERAAEYLREVIDGSKRFNLAYPIVRPRDGETRWVKGLGEVRVGPQGRPSTMFGTIQDITDEVHQQEAHRLLENRLLQTQKFESLGVLAGGIAHEFNNLLTSVLGNADLALQDLPADSPIRENILAIEEAARRAAEISRQMLAYSGRGRFNVRRVVLSQVILDMTRMLELAVSKKASLQFDLPDSLPPVEVDADQFRQLVMALVVNGSESLSDREGTIRVALGVYACDATHPCHDYLGEPVPPGCYVSLEVSDTGCGMDAETRAKAFDPFFSTKFVGRGLGLPATLGVVRGHRGYISITSVPLQGTTVLVLLPALGVPTALLRAARRSVPSREAAILVVDDEEVVRTLARKMVERCGYRAIEAADGVEALTAVRERGAELACVLLDLTMPRMDGEETLRELRRISPTLPVILSSGYHRQEIDERFSGLGLAGFVQKPYQLADLRRKLSAVLK